MKQIKIIVALAFANIVLFSGCTTNSSLTDNNVAANAKSSDVVAPPAYFAQVRYDLVTIFPPQDPLLRWNEGYITTNSLVFEGTNMTNEISMTKFSTNITQTLKLAGSATLGSVSVRYGKFDNVAFMVSLAPGNQAHALFLNGMYGSNNTATLTGKAVPVQIIVDQQVAPSSAWLDNTLINAPNYVSTLMLRMDKLTNGLTTNTLANAILANGMILISANSNVELYKMVVNNLQTAMTAQLAAVQVPVPLPAPLQMTHGPNNDR